MSKAALTNPFEIIGLYTITLNFKVLLNTFAHAYKKTAD
jgi:hypothetical protein